jgi:hypothetical protein
MRLWTYTAASLWLSVSLTFMPQSYPLRRMPRGISLVGMPTQWLRFFSPDPVSGNKRNVPVMEEKP